MAKDMPTAAPTVPFDEASWVEQARAGDMNALTRLVTRYQDRILNTCWRICGNLEDAQDLAQETFLKAIESLGTFRHKANFYTWVFRIAVNVSISHRRKAARSVKLSLHGRDGEMIGDQHNARLAGRVSEDPQDPPARLSKSETGRLVLEAMNELDEEHRAVLVLRDMEAFDYHQIAEILEVPVGTVKSRLHRARMELRNRVQPVLEDE